MQKKKGYIVDFIFVLVLFGVFMMSAFLLTTVGADVYKNTVSSMTNNYDTRTCISYLTEKIRQNGSIYEPEIITHGDYKSLLLYQDIDDTTYCTYIYEKDGYLMELFSKKNSDIGGELWDAGQKILEISQFDVIYTDDGLIMISITTPKGITQEIVVYSHNRLA